MYNIKNNLTGQTFVVTNAPCLLNGIWECGDQRFADPSGAVYTVVPPAAVFPVITPPQMRLLYTSAERVCIKANLASASPDPVIADFFSELGDPQLTQVNLNLASVQGAIGYSLAFVGPHMTPPYTADVIAARTAAMLTGVPQ